VTGGSIELTIGSMIVEIADRLGGKYLPGRFLYFKGGLIYEII
jgi:hypothetical protein